MCGTTDSISRNFITDQVTKKQKKQREETDKLTNKAISPCLQYPEDHGKGKRKCPSGFNH